MLRPHIKSPCDADWNKMKIGLDSRHCQACQKNVIDFTNRSREEIMAYLLEHRSENTCGRFYKHQLDYKWDSILLRAESYARKNPRNNLSFFMLTVAGLMLSSCQTESGYTTPTSTKALAAVHRPVTDQMNDGTPELIEKIPARTAPEPTDTVDSLAQPVPPPEDIVLSGEVMLGDVEVGPMIEHLPEVSAEFPGGYDSLVNYLNSKIKLPKKGPERTSDDPILVSFTIDEFGKVSEPELTRLPVELAKWHDDVLEAVEGMPDWIPARTNGKNVRSTYVLPVRLQF